MRYFKILGGLCGLISVAIFYIDGKQDISFWIVGMLLMWGYIYSRPE